MYLFGPLCGEYIEVTGNLETAINALFIASGKTLKLYESQLKIGDQNEFQDNLAKMARNNNHNLHVRYGNYVITQSFAIGLASR